MKVVMVDDAAFMRTVLKKILEELGHEVVAEGNNGLEAINLAKKYKPDVITLDITMPVLDGLQAIPEIIKASPESRIIMVSAMGQKPYIIESIKKGAKDFIVKPFVKDRISEAINKCKSRISKS